MDQRDVFLQSLRAYPANAAAQEAFITGAMTRARGDAAVAVAAMRGDEAQLSRNAELFLRSIDELAIQPLLDAPVPADPQSVASYVEMLVSPELALRQKIFVRIDTLLDDRRNIPLRIDFGPKPEEVARPRRVCDEAYVAMRSMVSFGEDLVQQFTNRDHFYAETEATRDAAIRQARRSPTWQRALGREPDDVPPTPARPRSDFTGGQRK